MRKRRLFSDFVFFVSALFLLIIFLAALAAPIISPFSPVEPDLEARLVPPLTGNHLMGTDELGRDLFSRIIHGARAVFVVGLTSVGIGVLLGTVFGLIAGLGGKLSDNFFMLLMDSVLSFPPLLLALAVITVMGYGLVQVTVALGVVFSPVFARLIRAETRTILSESYIESARALGSSWAKIIGRHVLPNMLPEVILQCAVFLAYSIVIEASLSFLGLGIQPPEPSWGLLLKDSRNYLFQAPWMAIFPAMILAATVFCLNYIGDILSETINPRLQQTR